MNVLSVPAVVFSEVTKYLGPIKSLVRLDSAMCNHHNREIWLHSLQSKQFTFHWCVDISKAAVLLWLVQRKISASEVQFSFNINTHEIASQYLSEHGSAVRSVRFLGGSKDHEMVLVALCCTNLTKIYIHDTALTHSFRDILVRNPKMQEIFCDNVICAEIDLLSDVSLHKLRVMRCRHVDTLNGFPWTCTSYSDTLHTMVWDSCPFDGAAMISLFRNCPVLRSFSVDSIRIGKKVPSTFSASLMNLCLCKNGTLFDDHILYLAKKLTSLRTLNIQHCRALTDQSLQHLAEHAGERLQVLYTDIKNPGNSETKPRNS